MKEVWDGTPRRKTDIYMQTLEAKIDAVHAVLCRQFGDIDPLTKQPVEGQTLKALRELNDKVAIQNGRVKKLEDRRQFYKYMGILAAGFSAACAFLAGWLKFKN